MPGAHTVWPCPGQATEWRARRTRPSPPTLMMNPYKQQPYHPGPQRSLTARNQRRAAARTVRCIALLGPKLDPKIDCCANNAESRANSVELSPVNQQLTGL